jgi:signal transduction histidine kinase
MSKIEAGRIQVAPVNFDLYLLVGTLEDMFQHRAVDKGLQFIVQKTPDLPQHIRADENKLRQVLGVSQKAGTVIAA